MVFLTLHGEEQNGALARVTHTVGGTERMRASVAPHRVRDRIRLTRSAEARQPQTARIANCSPSSPLARPAPESDALDIRRLRACRCSGRCRIRLTLPPP